MASYKAPDFQDRLASATAAKQKALAQLRAKAPVDEAVLAERRRKAEARAAKLAAKQAEKRAAKEEAARVAAASRAESAQEPAKGRPPLTDAERKAARDARYAARKARK